MHERSKKIYLLVRDIVKETYNTSTIYFDSEQEVIYEPGQFVTLLLNIEGEALYRAYSFCTSPYTDKFMGITVKRILGGKASNYLLDKVRIGDTIEAFYPTGHFTTFYNNDTSQKRHVLFLAGGSGIVPLFSMMKTLFLLEKETMVSLIYANSTENDIIFSSEFKRLKELHFDRFNLIYALSNPPVSELNAILHGRLDAALLENILLSINFYPSITEAFVCGPEPIMDLGIKTLCKIGVPEDRIYKENFNSAVHIEDIADNQTNAGVHQIKVIYEEQDYTIDVSPNQTILDAALANDVDIPFACSRGICNVCRAKKLCGEVEMAEDEGLSDEELNENYILTCVSYPKSNDVVIKVE
jgi:ring-1,2-phenylacetyl-CoA epoxidase subunit PaaE